MNTETPTNSGQAPQRSSSTGPRTEAGKSIASQNARKHDLCSRTLRLSPEEWAEYHDMRDRYGRDLQPVNDVEQNLVDEICFNYWRLQQAREVELDVILHHPTELRIIALYMRYRTGYERGYYKALDKIQAMQRERRKLGASVPRSPVRSAKSEPAPLAPVRSAETAASESAELQEQMENHLLENDFRAKVRLAPLPLPKELASHVDNFVSQNPGGLSAELLYRWKQAA